MALALGLGKYLLCHTSRFFQTVLLLASGSIFNHSSNPNVTYELDNAQACIKFTTTKVIQPDEELCIYYGNSLWFETTESPLATNLIENTTPQSEVFNLAGLENIDIRIEKPRLYLEEELPFEKVDIREEEDDNEIETGDTFPEILPKIPIKLITCTQLMCGSLTFQTSMILPNS